MRFDTLHSNYAQDTQIEFRICLHGQPTPSTTPTEPKTLNLQSTKNAVAPFLGLLLAACASIDSQDTEQYIFLEEADALFIEFNHSRNPLYESSMPELADNMEKDRRQDFTQVMQELLHDYQLPIQTYVLGKREEPGDGPVLKIYAMRFEQDRTGDLVATIRAGLTKHGELNTLGTYSQRVTPPAGANRQRMDEAFRDVIRKPLRIMMDDLFRHFPTPEERKSVNAPLIGIGEN